jgi:hypothetical protein
MGKPATRAEKLKEREAILALLTRIVDNDKLLSDPADSHGEVLNEYYTLTREELTALISGDMKKIESWVGKLDKHHAAWLWNRLNQEKQRGDGKKFHRKKM